MMPRDLCSYSIAMQGTPLVKEKITEWNRVPIRKSNSL